LGSQPYEAYQGLGASVQAAGGVIGQIAEHMQEVQAFQESANAKAATIDKYSQFTEQQRANQDPTTYEKNYQTFAKQTQNEIAKTLKTPGSKQLFNAWFATQSAYQLSEVRHSAWEKTRDNAILDAPNQARAIADGYLSGSLLPVVHEDEPRSVVQQLPAKPQSQPQTAGGIQPAPAETTKMSKPQLAIANATNHLEGLYKQGILTAPALEHYKKQVQEYVASKVLNDYVMDVAATSPRGWDEALDGLNDPKIAKQLSQETGMSITELKPIFEAVHTQATYQKAKMQERQHFQNQAEAGKILDALQSDTFDPVAVKTMIKSSSLQATGENSKEHWYGVLDSTIKAIQEGKKLPVQQSDPITEAAIQTAINLGDKTVTPELISSRIGKGVNGGLSGGPDGTAQKLIRSLDEKQKAKTTIARNDGTRYLLGLKGDGVFGGKDSEDANQKYAATLNEFMGWMDEHPDATLDESQAYLKRLTHDDRLAWVHDKYWSGWNPFSGFQGQENVKEREIAAEKAPAQKLLKQLAEREKAAKSRYTVAPIPADTGFTKMVVDPKTGQRLGWDGSKWVEIK